MAQDLLSILHADERTRVKTALAYLEGKRYDDAIAYCSSRLSEKPRDFEASFLNYTLGTANLRKLITNQTQDIKATDKAIAHLRKSLEPLNYADAHLMLADALQQKVLMYLGQQDQDINEEEAQPLVQEAINELRKAAELNPNYRKISEKDIDKLAKIQLELKKRILKKRATTN